VDGAHAVVGTLHGAGVDVCFTNPGTTEMHLVAALEQEPGLHTVPCLFEGVATGAADGFGRMTGRPAATLLHLGPGLGNGLANLHNARRAATPLVNLVGDHASYHKRYDAPLESDIEALAGTVSGWVRRCSGAEAAGRDAAEAVAAASAAPGRVATLILPADACWSQGASPASAPPGRDPVPVAGRVVADVAAALLGGGPVALLLGGGALSDEAPLRTAGRIAAATGARLLCETFPARQVRGAGLPSPERLGYLPEGALAQLAGLRHLVLVGAREPVSFFAYQGVPGSLVPQGCRVHTLAAPADDLVGALDALAERVDAKPLTADPERRPALPSGELTAESVAAAVGALLPEGAVVVDEANTSGLWLPGATATGPRHDWLTLTGGAIGQGLPLAAGAAIACPERRVLCLEADGSALYTLTALWTHAREQLDVTTVVLANRSYAVLRMEAQRLGMPPSSPLLDLARPDLDFVALARGMGVPGSRATTAEEFTAQLTASLAEPGPHLVEAVVPPLF
jgi:acetolactate synthase-1/2/3 large subunit